MKNNSSLEIKSELYKKNFTGKFGRASKPKKTPLKFHGEIPTLLNIIFDFPFDSKIKKSIKNLKVKENTILLFVDGIKNQMKIAPKRELLLKKIKEKSDFAHIKEIELIPYFKKQ